MKLPPQPYEFRSKPAWQRLLIMIGGVLVNFVLALFIYSMILFAWGQEYITAENVKYGYDFAPIAKQYGFEDGDKIIRVGDKVIDNYKDIVPALLIDNPEKVAVVRGNQEVEISLPSDFAQQVIASETRNLITIRVPFVVDTVVPSMAGAMAGLQAGDRLLGIGGAETPYFTQFNEEKLKYKSAETNLQILRGSDTLNLALKLDAEGVLGIYNKNLDYHFDISRIEYGFLAAIPAGINLGVDKLTFYVKQMKLVFTKEGASQIGGFGAIGGLFPKTWDWQIFWNMTAFLSIILAFMNILPIPALDGGHVAFLLYELITGRKPGDKFLEYAQITGMVILLSLLVFANGNDIYRAIQAWF